MMFLLLPQQVKGVSQNINYTTIALLPVLTSLFDHIAQHQFGDDVICEFIQPSLRFPAFHVHVVAALSLQWTTCRCPATASCAAFTHWEPSRTHTLKGGRLTGTH